MKAVILCGGSGTRLWPLSRVASPKQFAKIFDNKSLFELTIERNEHIVDGFIIIVNEKQLDLCKSQIPSHIKNIEFIIEPVGRNTAPAITLATLSHPEESLLVLPSDHLIKDLDVYATCVKTAKEQADLNNLVTFGIKAKHAETGYGYIEADGINVLSFKEKPDHQTAVQYVSSGNFFWNSGMFLFNSKFYLVELEKYSPNIFAKSKEALQKANVDSNTTFIQKQDMESIPEDSIDYAVMEHCNAVKVIPSPFYWSDLGSFDSLYEELDKNENGNTENQNHIALNSSNNLVISKKVIATVDVSDLIIVETDDTIMIAKKGNGQRVKDLLKKVKSFFPNLG